MCACVHGCECMGLCMRVCVCACLTCAVKKAGVRDPEGRAGLLRAMEPISLPANRIEGEEISRPLGFLLLGGSPLGGA